MVVLLALEVVAKEVLLKLILLKKPLILVFIKNPILGKVKTRLAKSIGDEKALMIYRLLLKKTAQILKKIDYNIHLYYSETIENEDVFDMPSTVKKIQIGDNLGQRMCNAFKDGFSKYSPVIIVGTDLWSLEESDFTTSVEALKTKEVVLGPSEDGGYYLLGLNNHIPQLFENKKWGTSSVLESTLKDLSNHKLYFLPKKNDIDTIDDLTSYPDLYNKLL